MARRPASGDSADALFRLRHLNTICSDGRGTLRPACPGVPRIPDSPRALGERHSSRRDQGQGWRCPKGIRLMSVTTRSRTCNFRRVKKPASKVYRSGSGLLFVPTEEMWKVHSQSSPYRILKTIGRTQDNWANWRKKFEGSAPWLFEWLYNHPSPCPDDAFSLTQTMLDFRLAARISSIASRAVRAPEQITTKRQNANVSPRLIAYWLAIHKDCQWFKPWLLRGEDAPPHVTIPSKKQIQLCRQAFDFAGYQTEDGHSLYVSYRRWISGRHIPDQAWLKWLFGGPEPEGAFIVDSALQRLRHEKTRWNICAAAGLNYTTFYEWMKSEALTARLNEALEAAGAAGFKSDVPPSLSAEWDRLHGKIKKSMWCYARAATLKSCLERSGIQNPPNYLGSPGTELEFAL